MTLVDFLPPEDRAAVERLRLELFPGHTPDAVAKKLIRDALIGCGVLPLPASNRSRGARRSAKNTVHLIESARL